MKAPHAERTSLESDGRTGRGESHSGSSPRLDKWQVLGMGGGGTMILPTISPHKPSIMVEGCDMTGCYLTMDGGRSYRMFNLRTRVRAFGFDPQNASVIYVANVGLWRSEDTGETWRLVFPDPTRNTVEHMRGDHADYVLTTDDPAYPRGRGSTWITALAVDPSDSRAVYVATHSRGDETGESCLCRTVDYGRTWQTLREFEADVIHRIDVDGKTGTVNCVGAEAVYRLSGTSWTALPLPEGVSFGHVSIGYASDGRLLIYGTCQPAWRGEELAGGLYVSEDGGMAWRTSAGDLAPYSASDLSGETAPPNLRAVACSATHAEVAYLGFERLALGDGRAQLYNGIAKTTDGGRTWQIVKKESNSAAPNSTPAWMEQRMPEDTIDIWFAAPYDIGAAPGDPDVCFATDLFRTCRTTDGGKTWETITSVQVGRNAWKTRGLDVTTCYGVHFDPFDRDRMYVSYTDAGLFRSEDGGRSWINSIEGIPERWRNTTYWVVSDPEVEGLMWGAFADTHDLPRPKMWRHRDPGSYCGGVATSIDGGQTWVPTHAGMGQSAITHILLDPTSPVGERTLYTCGFGKGVWKSADNGKSWELKRAGLKGHEPFAWRLARAADGALYLIVARRTDRIDAPRGTPGNGALYRSTDEAESWEEVALPDGCNGPMGLAIDPRDQMRLYLAAWGKGDGSIPDTGGGVFVSADGGQTWNQVMSQDQHIYDVTLDGRNGAVYACGFESSAYRSDDGGETWHRLKGFTFKWGHRVIPDPYDETKVYITTFGGSVWYGPARGDQDAVEDILTRLDRKP
jgi:photosystem II stability/assembly factor-like uncharacterized protein